MIAAGLAAGYALGQLARRAVTPPAAFADARGPTRAGSRSGLAGATPGHDQGNRRSPVSASSTKIALTGQFSAASRIFSSVSPSGLTASDWRFSLSAKTFGAMLMHIAFP